MDRRILFVLALGAQIAVCQRREIPKTWDDAALATLEIPLVNPAASAKHVSSTYYYKIPVRPIYRMYAIYAPGREPSGYFDWLRRQEPEILWDDKGHKPPLATEADWIKAGEMAFDAPVVFGPAAGYSVEDVRDPAWYRKFAVPLTKDGVMPFFFYTVREKGKVEIGAFGCGTCHTRVMDGIAVRGPQGNFAIDRAFADVYRKMPRAVVNGIIRGDYSVPWLKLDPINAYTSGAKNLFASMDAIPPGVDERFGTSVSSPAQIPDIIGVKDRAYLDHTGLQRHRSAADLMRYAAINQGADLLANHAGFIGAGGPNFDTLPDPSTQTRYSDEQLYAMGLYVYSLTPPANPNKFDATAARGQKIFEREGCAMCHTPPLYTNNKLTLAKGFTPTGAAKEMQDVMSVSVGTDPELALRTRRGTGYYKVPSLKGVWYREMFGHNGWSATLEDWFDPKRTRDDYVPTGFNPNLGKPFAVKGHPFGLNLTAEDRKALLAFLRTL